MPVRILLSLALLFPASSLGSSPSGPKKPRSRPKISPPAIFISTRRFPSRKKKRSWPRSTPPSKSSTGTSCGLIAKGAVIEAPDPGIKIYPKLTILDESGLVIIARQVPNLYYQYPGQTGINPNIYLIIKNARVNFPESYIRYSYVVEGDFVAYAHKFVSAILEGLERPAQPPDRQPAPPPR